jgi:GNAT superfamily N-acetyltransferase
MSPDEMQDLRSDFNERAAILEYDNGLTRDEAESQAVRELVDQLQDRAQRQTGIVAELAGADRRRKHPDLAEALLALGLEDVRAPTWGFDAVVPEDGTFRPAGSDEAGHQAVIVPAVDDGIVVDLAAQGLNSGRMLSRLGAATVIGSDEIERARQSDDALIVFNNATSWLRGHTRGVVVLNWQEAGRELEGVETLFCRKDLAQRLHEATRRCWPIPTIAVAEGLRHAA